MNFSNGAMNSARSCWTRSAGWKPRNGVWGEVQLSMVGQVDQTQEWIAILKGRVTELDKILAACRKSLTNAGRHMEPSLFPNQNNGI